MTQTAERSAAGPLDDNSQCDHCGQSARAWVRWAKETVLSEGEPYTAILDLCGSHSKRHAAALTIAGFTAVDDRSGQIPS